jgi:hypothetical protein
VPSEHHEAVHPWRVSQLRTSQQQLIGSERNLLRRSQVVDQLEGALEGVKGVVRLLRTQRAPKGGDGCWRSEGDGLRRGLFDLEVGLAGWM